MGVLLYTVNGVLLTLLTLRLYVQWTWGWCKSSKNMTNATVIVTGANRGLGKVTVEELAKRNARVILACRDVKAAEQTVAEIRRRTTSGELVVKHLDLASLMSVRKFARDILTSEQRIDLLVNNAGIMRCPYTTTVDGYEMMFGVNHLGHFLLTNLLLDRLKSSAPSRVVVVSSMLYRNGEIDFDSLSTPDEATYDQKASYRNSKLANVLFGRQLAERVGRAGVDVFVVSPGWVWTSSVSSGQRALGWWKMIGVAVVGFAFLRTPLQGCQTILHCALDEELRGRGGTFYRNCRESTFCTAASCDDTARRLWQVSETLTELKTD